MKKEKESKAVYLPVPEELQSALDALPVPKGTHGESRYFFWTGNGAKDSVIKAAHRTLQAVFKKSGGQGGTFEDVAEVLANSPDIVRRHYAQWSVRRQERVESLLHGVFSGTVLAQTEKQAVT